MQNAMRRRIDNICVQGVAKSREKRIYDIVYKIEAEKSRRAHADLVQCKCGIDHVQLDVQVRYEELRKRDMEEETCLNCGVKQMRVRTQPMQPFWETVKNAPPRPRERRPMSSREELRAVRRAEEMNEAMRVILEERRRYPLSSVRGFIGPLPRLIGLLYEDVREGSIVWAIPSPFLDPLLRRDIVSPFLVPHHLQQYPFGTWEH